MSTAFTDRAAVVSGKLSSRTSTRQWILVFVLFLAGVLNSADRTSLSVAAPQLISELHISPVEMGYLLSSFFWTYAVGQIVSGWFLDRYPIKWVFAIGFVVWTLATFCTGFIQGLLSLFILRLILGAGESVAYPAYSKIIASEFPPTKMGLPNAILNSGAKVGAALGILFGGMLIAAYGWRVMFFVLGGVGLVFLILWFIYAPEPERKSSEQVGAPNAGPSFWEILRTRDAWGTFIGQSGYTYAYFFGLTWLPTYLAQQRHIALADMGLIGALPFWGAAIFAILAGTISDSLISKGYSGTKVRKTFVATGFVLSVAAFPSATVDSLVVSLILLNIAYAGLGIVISNSWAITQTIAGPLAAGRWAGVQNCIGAVMGIIAPIVSGYIVQATGNYSIAFLIPAVLAVTAALAYVFIVGEVAPINWDARRTQR
jgi:ACS family D-galactonate transporter-like MFS transporter